MPPVCKARRERVAAFNSNTIFRVSFKELFNQPTCHPEQLTGKSLWIYSVAKECSTLPLALENPRAKVPG
jgi:hypothetical protein